MEIAWVIIQAITWNLQVSQGLWWAVVDNGHYLLKGSVIGRAFSLASAFLCLYLEGTKSVQKTSEAEASFSDLKEKKESVQESITSVLFLLLSPHLPLSWLGKRRPAVEMCRVPTKKPTQ